MSPQAKMDNKILIVDDDDAVRNSMREFIEISGYHTFSAASAEDALEILRTNAIQVVITDIMLGGMNGLELTDKIIKDYAADVIVMTGYSGDYSYEEAINKGASDLVFKPVRFEELLLRLKRVLKERHLTLERDHMLDKMQKLAITDGLTKLFNSRHFYNQLKIEVDRSNRYKHPLALLLLDIDHFKDYNDAYGHLEGDKVLIKIGEKIEGALRMMDSAYRYGGEEFTIILPETSGQEAVTVADRIRRSVADEKMLPRLGVETSVTISVGVTAYMFKEDLVDFIKRADKAMYTSKDGGRNQVSSL
jgi:diguanylate cyclase (GGDEF)-like protein